MARHFRFTDQDGKDVSEELNGFAETIGLERAASGRYSVALLLGLYGGFVSRMQNPWKVVHEIEALEGLGRTDVAATRARANAWAVGDIAALRSLIESEQTQAYLAALSGPFMTEHNLRDLFQRADKQWISAARAAIDNNTTTFSILPISMLLGDPRRLLAGLEEAGCVVEAPLD